MASDTITQLQSKINELTTAGRQYLEDEELQKKIADIQSRAENLIREYPLATVGGALLLGYIIGKIMSGDE